MKKTVLDEPPLFAREATKQFGEATRAAAARANERLGTLAVTPVEASLAKPATPSRKGRKLTSVAN